ncbi:hypothetical protein V2I01_42745 [Micromonospora sp. BRA006-A]|nr:hypothetical protein [Micromonospora sp. BRA006-A]
MGESAPQVGGAGADRPAESYARAARVAQGGGQPVGQHRRVALVAVDEDVGGAGRNRGRDVTEHSGPSGALRARHRRAPPGRGLLPTHGHL